MTTYEDLVSDNGNYTILAEVSDNDYQGETRFFLFDPATGRHGFTTVGWDSCPCCDPLEGCESDEERDALGEDLRNAIRWYHTMGQAKAAVAEYDFAGNYCGRAEGNEKFKLLVDGL